jgi:hypothetical protein
MHPVRVVDDDLARLRVHATVSKRWLIRAGEEAHRGPTRLYRAKKNPGQTFAPVL